MSQGISKTDQVLVLLNRLAVSEASSQSPEGEHLLGEYLVASQRQYDKDPFHNSHFHMDIEGQDPRRWSHMGKVHKDRRQSQNTQPAAALRIVLGDQRDSIIGERKLRTTDSFRTKLFGQDKRNPGEQDDFIKEAAVDSVRVHPLSMFRRNWDMAAIVLTMWTLLVLPFRAAFYWEYYRELEMHHNVVQQLEVDWMLLIELLIDIFFLSDIALNFNTGYISEQVLVMERKAVAMHYLHTWFILDLVASIPLALLLRWRRLDILRLPRLLKIIRMMQNKSFSQAVHDLRRSPLVSKISRFHIQIIQLFAFVFVWVHWDACLQYGACASQPPASACWVYASDLKDKGIFEKYSWAVLKAWSETIAAGYGRQDPQTVLDCWLTALSLLWGMCIWTFLGSIVTTLLIHLNAASSEYTAKITALNQYMAHRKLPQGLRQRIRDSYEARWKAEKHFDEEEIMQELPNSLRTEVCLYTCGDLIASVPFFEDAEEGFTTSVVTLLRPAVYLKGDMVIREGEVSREMYFIKSGAIQVEVDEQVVTVLKKGSYFGEIGLLRACRRTASIRAVSETVDLFVLSKGDFENVMKEYPESSKAMDLIAEHRLRALHASAAWQSKRDALTDYRSANLGAKIEHVLKMGDDVKEGSTDEGYHTLALHPVASSASHHTGNPFAAGNTPRSSAGDPSALLALSSGLPPLPASSSAITPRTSALRGPASRGASGLPDIPLRSIARGQQKGASSSSQGSPYALQRNWAPESTCQPPSSTAATSRAGHFKDLLCSLSLSSSPPKSQPRLSMLRRTASAGDFEHFHFLPDAATSSTVMAGRATGMMSRPGNQMRPESSKPFDILEVPEEGEHAEVKAPLLMMHDRQQ